MRLRRFTKTIKQLLVFVLPLALIIGVLSICSGALIVSFVSSIILPFLVVFNIIQFLYLLLKRNKTAFYSIGAIVLFFLYFDSFYQYNPTSDLQEQTVSILTYNLQGYTSKLKLKEEHKVEVSRFVHQKDVDIVCFQEFSAIEFKRYVKTYPYWIKSNIDMPLKSVLAVFSKFPIVDNGYIKFDNSINNAMFVDVEINGDIIRIYNLHLESFRIDSKNQLNKLRHHKFITTRVFRTEASRKAQAILVRNHVNNFKGKVILAGDFNSTQYSSIYRILKVDRKDTFTEAGNGLGTTFKLFNYPIKLDHILVDAAFEVVNHENFDIKLSDHEPVLAEIKL
ncbi:endonuclease/exonuclease/phosphatase family protein [Hyunsoonleella sp. 2307UL5-6]|uniref:endonuclease/exonuclease/phosphatase family protein n=1 Tax=Hyunsoonleella sp. 2307UL5-6 TaxID=3384768 RepID=UPI0039BCDBF6